MLYAFDFSYAGFTIEAAQDETGNIFITTATIENILGLRVNSCRELLASKSFKAFAGKDFHVGNFSDKSTKSNNRVKYYPKATFFQIIYFTSDFESYCTGQGTKLSPQKLEVHRKAKALIYAGFVADFEGSVQNAIGNQLSEEQREYLRELVFERIQCFKNWCDIIKDRYTHFYGVKPESHVYRKLVVKANKALFGVPHFNCDRNNMTPDQQQLIKDFETFLARIALKKPDFEPEALLDYCLDIYA